MCIVLCTYICVYYVYYTLHYIGLYAHTVQCMYVHMYVHTYICMYYTYNSNSAHIIVLLVLCPRNVCTMHVHITYIRMYIRTASSSIVYCTIHIIYVQTDVSYSMYVRMH